MPTTRFLPPAARPFPPGGACAAQHSRLGWRSRRRRRRRSKDGKFEPLTLEVPAGKRFKIEISNDGKAPMEFESKDLKQEKVLAAGAKSSVVINALKPGTYVFFDEHHPEAPKGQIVAK